MSITARLRRYQMLAFIGLGSMIANPTAEADDTFRRSAQQINEANTALANREFDTAISGYEAAAQSESTRDEATYNKAIALYRKGEVEKAGNLFASVASSLNDELAAKARFNAGNCHFAAAIEMQQQQPAIAIEQLLAAIEDYRSALSLDPTDQDARVNIELAAKMLKQLNRQQEQHQQPDQQSSGDDASETKSPDQSEQMPNQKGEDEKAAKQQEAEQQDSGQQNSGQQNSEQQNAGQDSSAQEADDQPTAEQQNAEQQNADQGTSGEQPNADQSAPSEQDAESQRNEQNANREAESSAENRQQPRSSSEQSDPAVQPKTPNQQNSVQQESDQAENQQPVTDPSPADQQNVTGELSATNESMPDAAQSNQNTVAVGESKDVMTEQEARKMLQAIRDRDLVRRLRRQAAERSRRIPVDKDW